MCEPALTPAICFAVGHSSAYSPGNSEELFHVTDEASVVVEMRVRDVASKDASTYRHVYPNMGLQCRYSVYSPKYWHPTNCDTKVQLVLSCAAPAALSRLIRCLAVHSVLKAI